MTARRAVRLNIVFLLQVVAIGKCNHKSVCGRCSLRLIMLYQDTKCPLCKTDLEQVNHIRCIHGAEHFASYLKERKNKSIDTFVEHGFGEAHC